MTQSDSAARNRWLLVGIFLLSSAINYLDRQSLATLAPIVRAEFHLSNADYGWILAAFSIAYAASAPFAGMLIDRDGLNRVISVAVGVWSCAGIATGFTRGFAGLLGCRALLGAGESAGFPACGKAIRQYLRPAERALGNALNQTGVSLGMVLAPPVATWIAIRAGWRAAFVATGVLGLVWIPAWNWAARRGDAENRGAAAGASSLMRDRRLWIFVAANALSMVGYSLWTNWTTLYFVDVHHLTLVQAAWYAWIPPVTATLGGFAGGWLSLLFIRRGATPARGRLRVCALASVVALVAAAVPAAPTAAWAAAGISLSIAALSAFSVNMYTLPLDVFSAPQAAFAVACLTASYGAVQAVVSPAFGRLIDLYGYPPVAALAAVTPLAAAALLWGTRAVEETGSAS